jgi:hypothetical protein
VATLRRNRISVADARRRLEALAPPPPDQGGAEERECVICLAAARTTRFGECGHSQLCAGECLARFFARGPKPCPQCRRQVRREALLQGAHIAQEPTFVQVRGR